MPRTARRASGVWPVSGWPITEEPGMPSRPSHVLVGLAWLGPSSPVAQGSNGIEQLTPGGGGRGRAATRSSATIPRNTTAGGFVCGAAFTTYVRFCDLRTKRCVGAPANQAAANAIADALAGGPLTRRKVHAFAKHPSGSRPGAPGARLPSDVVVLGPSAPKPAGPACFKAQGNDLGNQGAVAPEGGPRRTLPAGDPRSRDGSEHPVRPMSPRHDEDEADRGTREGNPRPQGVAQAERSPGGQDPTATRHRETNNPQEEAHGHMHGPRWYPPGWRVWWGPQRCMLFAGPGAGGGGPDGPGKLTARGWA